MIGIPMSVGPIARPLLGGIIYSHGRYYAMFSLMFAMLAVDAMLWLAIIEKRVARRWLGAEAVQPSGTNIRFDPPAGLVPYPESSDPTYTMIGNGNGMINTNGTSRAPPSRQILRHDLPSVLRLLLSFRMLVGLLQSSLNVAFDSTLPLTIETLFGWQQTGRGLIFTAILIPSLLQPVFGAITDRYQQGRRLLAADGCLPATLACVLLRLVTQDTLGQKALLCILLVITGLGMAIAMPAIIVEIGATVANAEENDP
ncbi:hypothetical protein G7Y89_g3273 [Cudoniella acicularis]|uniref:Major facilitator superfamily (MFS) profile domain-containing protein n=1 Tax=Cudoniella acicularis TaxID=354080 RepID=A0A8H4RTR6_9HELO|nr:hypothetical protein G7Y89_g3273 [Cudoniella acicularis]